MAGGDFEQLYLTHRALVERTIGWVCRRHHASAADAEEFTSVVHLRMVEDDYAVLRAYQGRSELGAYLQAVVRRLFQDWRNETWGRWRPSVAARRHGPVAVLLETLLVRDGLPLAEAIELMRTNHGVSESPRELDAMAAMFPSRPRRTFTTVDAAEAMPADRFADADAAVAHRDAVSGAERVSVALDAVLDRIGPQDRLILRMRFDEDLPVSAIARTLGLDQMSLYRRLARLLAEVKRELERSGVTPDAVRELLSTRGFDRLLDERSEGNRP